MVFFIVFHWNANHYGRENDRRCHDADKVEEEDRIAQIVVLVTNHGSSICCYSFAKTIIVC